MRPIPGSGTLVALAVLGTACSTAPPAEDAARPEPEVMDVAGVYDGSFDVQGQAVSGILELQQDGTDLTGTFTSPMGVSADGTGTLDGDRIRMELDYVMECPGTATLEGRVRDGATRISGTFDASDCTGGASGSFTFSRG